MNNHPMLNEKPRPEVSGDGRLCFLDDWVPLSPLEERIAAEFAERFGNVVAHERLGTLSGGPPLSSNAIRVHIKRFRDRIAPLGLVVRTVHGRGYVLEQQKAPNSAGTARKFLPKKKGDPHVLPS
jgi:DNA-binding response OmpR family regulator